MVERIYLGLGGGIGSEDWISALLVARADGVAAEREAERGAIQERWGKRRPLDKGMHA